MTSNYSRNRDQLRFDFENEDAVKFCVQYILSWIATSDGFVSDEEKDFIVQALGVSSLEKTEAIFSHTKNPSVDVIQSVCSMCNTMTHEQKEQLLELAIIVALSDGVLAIPEIHILHLLSDVLGFDHTTLNQYFHKIAGRDFPKPSDISDKTWWEQRYKDRSTNQKDTSKEQTKNSYESNDMTRIKALSILGLENDATFDEVKIAYRRLANVHHPDKFHSLGVEAVEVATATFKRINKAYEYLRA